MNIDQPPFRIVWEKNRWHYLLDGGIGNPVGELYGTYPPMFLERGKGDDKDIQEKARQIARGYEGTFFFYDLVESRNSRGVPFQLATPTIHPAYDVSQGNDLEPVSYPFEIVTSEQSPTRRNLMDDVIKEAKRRGLLDMINTFKIGDHLRSEERSIVPVQLYRRK